MYDSEEEPSTYEIISHVTLNSLAGIHALLVRDLESGRHNYYLLDYWHLPFPIDAEAVVKHHAPQPLDIAKRDMPFYGFDLTNYGF